MYTIQIFVRCPDEDAEIAPSQIESAACLIEESISLLLLQLFGVVLVDMVNITFSAHEESRGNQLTPVA